MTLIGRMVGPRVDSLDLKGHTTVVWALGRFTAEISLRHTTKLACTQESTYLVSMQRLCLLSGSFKLDLARGSTVRPHLLCFPETQ